MQNAILLERANQNIWILINFRHHNLASNKSKIMKHNDDMDTVQQYFVESEPQPSDDANANAAKIPIKHFPLKSIPLYHAHYHQHMHNTSDLLYESVRNRSSIRKRASAGEKQISTNITMVLEDLLKWVHFHFF